MFLKKKISSQSSGNNDNWDGFESDYQNTTNSYQSSTTTNTTTTTTKTSRSTANRQNSTKQSNNDFNVLDVKSSRAKGGDSNKNKSIEDDAWNLLNN